MSENTNVTVRVVLFDIYQTLLTVEPPPPDAETRWSEVWAGIHGSTPSITLTDMTKLTGDIVSRHHASARALGIPWPEVYWPDVVREAVPELRRLSGSALDTFLFCHAQLQRTVRLAPDAHTILRGLLKRGTTMGLVSNAQPYTMREVEKALEAHSLGTNIFRSDLCFFSFQNGYSKPDPHVFRSLTARLRIEGICPQQIMMVGDRTDNDIAPAHAHGWRTWRLTHEPVPQGEPAGTFQHLGRFLDLDIPA